MLLTLELKRTNSLHFQKINNGPKVRTIAQIHSLSITIVSNPIKLFGFYLAHQKRYFGEPLFLVTSPLMLNLC